jgi:hypothetical protein
MAVPQTLDEDAVWDATQLKERIETAVVQLKVVTPCEQCPKYQLYPGPSFGLHPRNQLAVRLYYSAARERRVGTFAGAFLSWTLSPVDADAVIRRNAHQLGSEIDEWQTFEKLMVIDQAFTVTRGEREAAEAERKSDERQREQNLRQGS